MAAMKKRTGRIIIYILIILIALAFLAYLLLSRNNNGGFGQAAPTATPS